MRTVKSKLFLVFIIAALLGVLFASPAEAGKIKWRQPPDKTPQGMDIRCDRTDAAISRTVADDFKCISTGYITDVHIWGSWKGDIKGNITQIHLSLHKDIPATVDTPSMPGALLWEKDFYAGDFVETRVFVGNDYEWWWDPYSGEIIEDGDQVIWRYDMFINRDEAYKQEGTLTNPLIYWLDVWVRTDDGEFGWKTSFKHWNDDAAYLDTSGAWRELIYPDEHPYGGESIDMAFAITTPRPPYIVIDTFPQWEVAVQDGLVGPVEIGEWNDYMQQWETYGDPCIYPDNVGLTPDFSAYPGNPCTSDNEPASAGAVMAWAGPGIPTGVYGAGWKLKYPSDPDMTNTIVTVTVLPPCDPGISTVSFGMKEADGDIRAWYWDVPGTVPCGVATTITIDTSILGVNAGTPVATSWMNNPGFDITQVLELIFDENAIWLGGTSVPPPGTTVARAWNYWYDLTVTPKLVKTIGPLKWSQPPKELDPGRFLGWDEESVRYWPPLMADDWHCKDQRPVTDIHWWGSHLGWIDSNDPPLMPIGFHFGIWTDVPVGADLVSNVNFSHPGEMIWEHECYDYHREFVAYDKDPRGSPVGEPEVHDSCFQYYCDLPESVWFYQKPSADGHGTIYWLSIAAIYQSGMDPEYPWGWKTRPHFFQDDAVRIRTLEEGGAAGWPPSVGAKFLTGQPIEYPDGVSWDLAFELTTNKTDPPPFIDSNFDGVYDFFDFAFDAQWWLVDLRSL